MDVLALGSDKYWLQSVQKALSNDLDSLKIVEYHGNFQINIDNLPIPDSKTLLLVDISEFEDAERAIVRIRAMGWKYVIAVAADPSAKEATAVLRRNLGYDYWEKTYDEPDIKKEGFVLH